MLLTAKQLIDYPREQIRKKILNASIYAQEKLDVDIIQLGAFTTSVTNGGKWLQEQDKYKGYVNHGDSYTAAVTCQVVEKLVTLNSIPEHLTKLWLCYLQVLSVHKP